MKTGYTDITVVLDKSGSMSRIAADTVGSFNSFIAEQTKIGGDCTITLVQFGHKYEKTYDHMVITEAKDLVLGDTYIADGHSTALHDAIGRAIVEVGKKYAAMDESERPEKVVFVILTDGEENSSQEYHSDQIQQMIKDQTDKYSWEFIFMGANQDAIKTGTRLGITVDNSLSYAYSKEGITLANSALATKVSCYRSCGIMPAFTQEDRAAQSAEGAQ